MTMVSRTTTLKKGKQIVTYNADLARKMLFQDFSFSLIISNILWHLIAAPVSPLAGPLLLNA